jgi:hypothetical protein
MPTFESFGQAFVVASQTTKARQPTEGTFDDPAPREQHKTTLGLGMLDHFQPDSVLFCRLRRVLAGVALIDKCDLNALATYFLQ